MMGEDAWLDSYWEDRLSGIGDDFQDPDDNEEWWVEDDDDE